ncbi:hypothetical protein JTE90_002246 [Oedothorax gibbosus]|uniref:Uncharacterized protein n=1 Tax=Oedothorax gibbosus TaxID=931172 RepID=A0AAV6V7T6_9ARAC|nr:hypothetical protein JTE90_002246 [Oedothorax gibbosus]
MKPLVELIIFVVLTLLVSAEGREPCDKKLHNCTGMMQPVLNEVRYMFPTTQMEIEGMCKVWSHIMDCVRKYVMDCSSEEQRTKFNDAVSNSIDSVHAICSSERYRRDYLEYATCFRKVSMENCGHHFKKMVDSAYNPHSQEIHICCAYRQYEKCVSDPIQRLCGPQALHILDDSMSSLKSRCESITKSMKATDKICPPEVAVQDTQEYHQPRPSLRHVDDNYSPLSTAGYVLNSRPVMPYTTPAWTPRTVIYPLPVTRHSSRVSSRNAGGWSAEASAYQIIIAVVVGVVTLTVF